jgi:hypothetical protein
VDAEVTPLDVKRILQQNHQRLKRYSW